METKLIFVKTSDDTLQHYGIKGMKWGVRRSEAQLRKARIAVKGTKDVAAKRAPLMDVMGDVPVPLPVAGAIAVGDKIGNVRAKRKVAKALDGKVKDFNKKDLSYAAETVRRYSGVVIKAQGKTVTLRDSKTDKRAAKKAVKNAAKEKELTARAREIEKETGNKVVTKDFDKYDNIDVWDVGGSKLGIIYK